MKTCKDCQSPHLVPRGPKYFRNQCHTCWNASQRKRREEQREAALARSRKSYRKHAARRSAESAARNRENPELHALEEWFRRKGIPVSTLDKDSLRILVEMKKALKEARDCVPKQ